MLRRLTPLALLVTLLLACSGDDDDSASTPATTTASSALTTAVPGAPLAWGGRAPLPTPRSEVASAVLDNRIYIIGGFNAQGQSTNVVEVYTPVGLVSPDNHWERLASMPEPRDHPMAAAFAGKVYVFGGGLGQETRSVFAYDPASDTWTRMADMPFRRTAGGAAVLGDRIIVAGGTGDSPATSMVYDPARDSWSVGPALSEPREHLAVAAANGRVYVIGGRWEDVLKSKNEVLDSPTGSWRTVAPMPTARGGTAGGVADGRIFVAGGEAFNPTRTFVEVEVYDSAIDSWSRAPDLPSARHGLAVQGATVRGITEIYVIGGGPTAGLSVTPLNEALSPK
jgi:N-acetylneuraminic acid mutarotase